MEDWGTCSNCCREEVQLFDGYCIDCASKRHNKFSKIYGFIAKLDLRHSERLVLSHIYSWQDGCWEENKTIGDVLGIHPRTVQKAVRVLREKRYIEYKPKGRNGRVLTVTLEKAIEMELPLWARANAAKNFVNDLAEKLSGVPPGHRGTGHKA